MIKQFEKKFRCQTCNRTEIEKIMMQATNVALKVVKKNPCMSHIGKHIATLIVAKVENNFQCKHFEKVIQFATEKSLSKAAKLLRDALHSKLKAGKKPVTYSHYKLKILK